MLKANMSDNQTSENKQIIYEIIMAVLSLIMVAVIILEDSTELSVSMTKLVYYFDMILILVFAADYFVRLALSKNKRKYIKENIIELISIIPFNSVFQALRLVRVVRVFRLIRVLRLFAFLNVFYKKADKFIKTNNFNNILYITCVTIFIGALGISVVENMKFSDALWWSFVTVTTVGYGDISPSTSFGRIIAVILMIVGIGFLGMFTGTIATFFIKKKVQLIGVKEEAIISIKGKLDDFDNLDQTDIDDIYKILKSLKEK